MIGIVERLRFDAARCEATFSKGVASNIEEAANEIERLQAALDEIAFAVDLDEERRTASAALNR